MYCLDKLLSKNNSLVDYINNFISFYCCLFQSYLNIFLVLFWLYYHISFRCKYKERKKIKKSKYLVLNKENVIYNDQSISDGEFKGFVKNLKVTKNIITITTESDDTLELKVNYNYCNFF